MAAIIKHLHQHLTHRHVQKRARPAPASSPQAAPAAWDSKDAVSGEAPEAIGAALTVGCFDVTHRGHKVLIDRLMAMGDVVSVGCVMPRDEARAIS